MTTALTKKALLSLLAASAVAIATPTLAQSYGGHGGGYNGGHRGGYNGGWNGGGHGRGLNAEQAQLAQRIDRAAWRGTISRREARDLRYQLDQYERLEWRYRRDGLSRWERNDLAHRLDRIRRDLREDRRDGGRRDRW
ncbi:hypothetical protein [Brevundimonas aurifodinae]|uniref:Zinc resistance-associated protein n=2 Tax=Brevundimonas TaxID=41275 RepID=A0ABV1NSV1_9CAUL|nr:MAG: hypothetical protein B7Z42_08135 [Brevundimonas sp. 12-68-7]OYX34077.1 MAG: hypothetical protein B7Z01_06980 [Brevundimonas subvibrioides]